jgi:hypothetical protein
MIQIFQLLALSGLTVYFFATFSYKLDLTLSLGAAALVGPSYDIFKGFQNQFRIWKHKRQLTNTSPDVLTE